MGRKRFSELNKNKNRVLRFATSALLVSLLASCIYCVLYSEKVSRGLEENILRLHVIANSDSQEDQDLKTDVKNAVLEYMSSKLEGSNDVNETKKIIEANIENIKELVCETIKARKKNYQVEISTGKFPFPAKTYGDISLPAGNYHALKIKIGKGEGSNWWCVLFPPLCFVDITHGTVPDSVKEELRDKLTEEEYSIITSAGSEKDIPVKIRFKIVEFFRDSRVKFSGLISKLFNTSN
ncbi:MAG: stage II sporulation protein R [Clostridiaceae bacterium]|nr:stage II sporulation protein R [Clostridiaceae bacterium]